MESKKSKQVDMLHGTLLDKIFLFALPLAASSILLQLFNSADVAVVGRFAGSQAQAAVGSTSAVSAGMILYFLMHEEPLYRLNLRKLRIEKVTLQKVLAIGIPAGLQGIVFSLSTVLIQYAINSFGSSAVAGSTVAANFEYISYYAVNAFSQTTVKFTGQNFGARDIKRCKKIFQICMAGSVLISGMMSIAFCLGRYEFAGIFAVDEQQSHLRSSDSHM